MTALSSLEASTGFLGVKATDVTGGGRYRTIGQPATQRDQPASRRAATIAELKLMTPLVRIPHEFTRRDPYAARLDNR
jgi:hypothetical protein